jgi:hypothetical protein
MKYLLTVIPLVLAFALPANAQQQLSLQISGGRVTLNANNVPVRQILAEWARIGGTKVVGAEKITGAPLTIKLVDMSERQALDIILRNVAGFIAAPRTVATTGASSYDRILVMATSANANAAGAAGTRAVSGVGTFNQQPAAMNGTQRRVPPRPPNLPPSPADDQDTSDVGADEPVDTNANQPVFTFPNPSGVPGQNGPTFVPMQNGAQGSPQPGVYSQGQPTQQTPVITLQPGANGPTIYNFVPTSPSTAAPTSGFGVVGSPTPGMIQTPQPPTPPPGTRPPGN